jgi:hypothetical protein
MVSDVGQDSRQSPRVVLRKPRSGSFGEETGLVLELGLGGAKLEHRLRLAIGTHATLVCGPLIALAVVRHSTLLPTANGVLYQTGLQFEGLSEALETHLHQLLMDEAQEQVHEWEANLEGVGWRPTPAPRSAAKVNYISIRKTAGGWLQQVTTDPNQPLDGLAVPGDTTGTELEILRRTYDRGDETTRELMRRMAMVGILERVRSSPQQ